MPKAALPWGLHLTKPVYRIVFERSERMASPGFLDAKMQEFRSRLAELEPAYHEYVALQRAIEALEENLPPTRTKPAPAAAKPAPSRPAPKPKKPQKRRRPGVLKTSLMEMVAKKPGLTAAQLAKELNSARPSLVTLAKRLEQDGVLERRRIVTPEGARVGFFPK
jgi:hypothetical protein